MSAKVNGVEFVAFYDFGKGFLSVFGEDLVDSW